MCFYSNYSVWVCVHLQNWNFWVVGCSENIVTRWTSFPLVKLLVGMMRFWGKSLVKLSFIFPFSAKSKIIKVFFWFSIYLLISTYFNTLKLYVWVCEYEYNACREKKKEYWISSIWSYRQLWAADVVAGVQTYNSSDHHYFLTVELSLFCSPYLLLFLFLQQGLSL